MTKQDRAQIEDIKKRLLTKADNSEKMASAGGWSKEHVADYKGKHTAFVDSAELLRDFLNGTYTMSE